MRKTWGTKNGSSTWPNGLQLLDRKEYQPEREARSSIWPPSVTTEPKSRAPGSLRWASGQGQDDSTLRKPRHGVADWAGDWSVIVAGARSGGTLHHGFFFTFCLDPSWPQIITSQQILAPSWPQIATQKAPLALIRHLPP